MLEFAEVSSGGPTTFLDHIVARTLADLEQRKRETPLPEVVARAANQPPPRDFLAAVRAGENSRRIHVIAEVKRASPSKGLLAPNFDPLALARTYAANGAAAISVLTEPHFFLGSSAYLAAIKGAVSLPVLCKDFISDDYQVYEARAWGADAILLICALLDDTHLRHLLALAQRLGMLCLVETHNAEEVRRAVAAGALLIGVNSRDLKTFKLHPTLLRELRTLIPADRVVVAESGIATAPDARRLDRYDIHAMLVGEALVTSGDIPTQLQALLQAANQSVQVKICGLSTAQHLRAAIEAGADLFGFIFHEASSRAVTPAQAAALMQSLEQPLGAEAVGVFVNKDAGHINEVAEQVGLNIVQLHGDETPAFCQHIRRPTIKALPLRALSDLSRLKAYREVAWRILLDAPTPQWGGSGVTHDWRIARAAAQKARVILAGGLNPENVRTAISQVRPWGVDVSSGVETQNSKNAAKIRAFLEAARHEHDPQLNRHPLGATRYTPTSPKKG